MTRNSLIILSILNIALTAYAETIKVEVPATFEPSSSVGLLITTEEVLQFTNTSLNKVDKNKYTVEFDIPTDNKNDSGLASAIVFSSDGDIAFAPTKDLQSRLPSELPHCPADKAITATEDNQVELLQSLVSIRASRRRNSQDRLNKALSGALLEKIQKLEKGFGISYIEPLSAQIPPVELVDRLTRILNAVRNFQQSRKPSVAKTHQ